MIVFVLETSPRWRVCRLLQLPFAQVHEALYKHRIGRVREAVLRRSRTRSRYNQESWARLAEKFPPSFCAAVSTALACAQAVRQRSP